MSTESELDHRLLKNSPHDTGVKLLKQLWICQMLYFLVAKWLQLNVKAACCIILRENWHLHSMQSTYSNFISYIENKSKIFLLSSRLFFFLSEPKAFLLSWATSTLEFNKNCSGMTIYPEIKCNGWLFPTELKVLLAMTHLEQWQNLMFPM